MVWCVCDVCVSLYVCACGRKRGGGVHRRTKVDNWVVCCVTMHLNFAFTYCVHIVQNIQRQFLDTWQVYISLPVLCIFLYIAVDKQYVAMPIMLFTMAIESDVHNTTIALLINESLYTSKSYAFNLVTSAMISCNHIFLFFFNRVFVFI